MKPLELMSPDLVRLVFVIGMVLSVCLYEKSHLTTGSIVVPGFLGINIFEPALVIFSILNAIFCFWLVHRLVPRFCLMRAKSKFDLLIITSVSLRFTLDFCGSLQLPIAFIADSLGGMGYVIPGLIAHDMSRNGVAKTSLNALGISAVVGGCVLAYFMLTPEISFRNSQASHCQPQFDLSLVMLLSIIAAIILRRATVVSGGGYVTAAFIASLGFPAELIVLLIGVAWLTYLLNTRLMARMIVFGRRKFSLMLITGSVIMWTAIGIASSAGIGVEQASNPQCIGIMILIPGLIANEIQRFGFRSVATGCVLSSAWIYSVASIFCELQNCPRPVRLLHLVGTGLLSGLTVFYLRKTPDRERLES